MVLANWHGQRPRRHTVIEIIDMDNVLGGTLYIGIRHRQIGMDNGLDGTLLIGIRHRQIGMDNGLDSTLLIGIRHRQIGMDNVLLGGTLLNPLKFLLSYTLRYI